MTKKPETKKTGLELLREPFPEHQISKLPKPTKQQTDAVKSNYQNGVRCKECGGWHHPNVVHLDYVGHAALTDRLLDADPAWTWEPMALTEQGLPQYDGFGGLWIKLTVCDQTRLGYGHPDGKTGGDAVKEIIGDALRNAAMRFGAALDLWHKGDLHGIGEQDSEPAPAPKKEPAPQQQDSKDLTELKEKAKKFVDLLKNWDAPYEQFSDWITSRDCMALQNDIQSELPKWWSGDETNKGVAGHIQATYDRLKNRDSAAYGEKPDEKTPFDDAP